MKSITSQDFCIGLEKSAVNPPAIQVPTRPQNALSSTGNRLSEIPSCIGNLEALETLELSDNALQSLPSSIGNLARLTKLMANKNKLACLPESLGRLSVVSLVDVSRNSIERFPDALQHLDALTLLDARENRLREVPPLPQSDRLAQVGSSNGQEGGQVIQTGFLLSILELLSYLSTN